MPAQHLLKAIGLQSNTNHLSTDDGGLDTALNVVIDKRDLIESRRGFNTVGSDFDFLGESDAIFSFQNSLIASNGTDLAYDSAFDSSNPVWSNFSGTYAPPSNAQKIHFSEGVNSNLYFTSSIGIYKMDDVSQDPFLAGAPKGLDGTGVVSGASGWFNNNSNVAYQVVWGYTDRNSNLILGVPSQLINVTNTAGGDRNVDLNFTVPQGLSTSYFWQLYRSAQTNNVNVVAGDNFQLVAQKNLTAGEITALEVSYTDETPDDLKGAFLYTDATQQGPLQTNDQPPLCVDLCLWKGMMFYVNVSSKQRSYLTLISVGAPDGFQIADTITITRGASVYVYTGAAANDAANREFEVVTAGTPASNIDETARNLVSMINRDPNNTYLYAYYVSGAAQLPGQILLEERNIGGAEFSVISDRGNAFSPQIPSSGTTYVSSKSQIKSGLMVSKVNQNEAVPLVNLFYVGAANQESFRCLALTDAVYILKEDGVFRATGDNPQNLVISPAYPDTVLLVKESAVVLNNSIYAYTNQGITTINQSEPQLISFPIEDQLFIIQNFTNFHKSFGVAYPSDRKYIFCTLSDDNDTLPTQSYVYNYITQTWTQWDKPFTCGYAFPFDRKLYFGNASIDKIFQERKSYSVMDYADRSFTCNIVSFSGKVVEVDTTVDAQVGYSIGQPGVFLNAPTVSIITAIQDPTHVVVSDTFQWTIGPAFYYEPIDCRIGWIPTTGGAPIYLKHWQTLKFFVQDLSSRYLTASLTTDISPYKDEFLISSNVYGFGEVPFGNEIFGGFQPRLQSMRVLVPREKAMSNWIDVNLAHKAALNKFVLAGAALEFEMISTRMR